MDDELWKKNKQDIDKSEIDEPELNESELDESELNKSEIDEPELDESELNESETDESELDESELNESELDESDIDKQEQILEFSVKEEHHGIRIDKYLSDIQTELSRTYIQRLIEEGKIFMDHLSVKANTKVKSASSIVILLPKPKELEIIAQDIPLDIIFEDKDIIIINKHKGLVVHPGAGHTEGTLVNALLFHCRGELSGINGVLRPGIVHRIDRDTTGVIVVCKNDKAHQFIAEQLKVHSITRKYQAIVYHTFKTESGRVEAPIGRDLKDRKKMAVNHKNGKFAATNYRVLENLHSRFAYIECSLETGRTHQIRVHMASIHHPLIGDTVYGPAKDPFLLEGQALHAAVLGFIHPTTKEYVEFHAPLPAYFSKMLDKLRDKG